MSKEDNLKERGEVKKNKSNKSPFKILNIFLVVIILISGTIFVYLNFFYQQDDNAQSNDQDGVYKKNYNTNLVVTSIIPSRNAGIINGHEHILNSRQAGKWLEAMNSVGVSTTVMLGSPDVTFHLPTNDFNRYKENNEELFEIADKYPNQFIVFPTIYTYDENKLDLLKSYINRGALGLKLFNGHNGSFYKHLGPLNHNTMYPIYEYCETERIPIIWHVHLGVEQIKAEFEDVLEDFPNLIINVPHFMLSSIKSTRLEHFLNTYPNLYTDISFGEFAKAGLWRLSNLSAGFNRILTEYQDRITFGTDVVVTGHSRKDVEWLANITQGYIDMLEERYFNLTVKGDIEGDFNGNNPGTHNGLYLSQEVLSKIYYDNMIKFLNSRFYYEDLSDVINESQLTYQQSNYVRNNTYKSNSRGQNNYNSELVFIATEDKRFQGSMSIINFFDH